MYRVTDLADGGAHGSVYKGLDTLDRQVAVKFIRPSVGSETFVREQAQALARVESEHVVSIIAIEDVIDPETSKLTLAIIMPWLEGKTLERLLRDSQLTLNQVKRIGIGMIIGMKAIHDENLVHGDFHYKNVMVGERWIKIIDILYYNTLANDSSTAQDIKRQTDRNALRSHLADLLTRISINEADVFSRSLSPESTLDDIHVAFIDATTVKEQLDIPSLVESAVARVSDPAFVDGDEYARALSEEIRNPVVRPLLEALIAKGMTLNTHRAFLAVLWDRLTPRDQEHICVDLSSAINREVPAGNFGPHLRMLAAFGSRGWSTLTKATSIRLENAITAELLSGRYYAQTGVLRGPLGTWAKIFIDHFKNPGGIRDTVILLLRSGWDAQNYVGKHFMKFIPRLATTADERKALIESIGNAVADNAWTVIAGLDELPQDWRDEILELNKSDEDGQGSEMLF